MLWWSINFQSDYHSENLLIMNWVSQHKTWLKTILLFKRERSPFMPFTLPPTPDQQGLFLQNLVIEKTIHCTFSSAAAAAASSKSGLFTQNLVENNTLSIKKGAHPHHLWHHYLLQTDWEQYTAPAPIPLSTKSFTRWKHLVMNITLQGLPTERAIGIHKFQNIMYGLKGKPKWSIARESKGWLCWWRMCWISITWMPCCLIDFYDLNA